MPDNWPPRIAPHANPLSNPHFDRAAHRRTEEAWLAEAIRAGDTRLTLIWRGRSLVGSEGHTRRAAFLRPEAADPTIAREHVFLGMTEGRPHFALDISALEQEEVSRRFGAHGAFEDLRMVGQLLPAEDAALLAYAKGILWWHERHRFCGVCGHPTKPVDGGHRRLCTNEACKAEQFPRSDPAVIMLIEYEGKCLLARGARFPAGFVSVLAGFVEPGESLEDTVAREVFEECGIRVTDIAYSSSQPWPFPSSLMLGFRARALDPTFDLDQDEISEAAWYTRDEVRALTGDGPMRIPPRFSISRRLIDDWIEEGD
jgi:NAD+ diphosphatase